MRHRRVRLASKLSGASATHASAAGHFLKRFQRAENLCRLMFVPDHRPERGCAVAERVGLAGACCRNRFSSASARLDTAVWRLVVSASMKRQIRFGEGRRRLRRVARGSDSKSAAPCRDSGEQPPDLRFGNPSSLQLREASIAKGDLASKRNVMRGVRTKRFKILGAPPDQQLACGE